MVLGFVVGVLATSGVLQTPGTDWPHWRGPDSNGISRETSVNKSWASRPPKMLWKVDMTDQGHSGPIVANGMVYIVDHSGGDDIVRALSFKDGSDVWRYTYPDPRGNDNGFARATPAYDDGKLYTMSQTGTVNCLDADKGKLIWSKSLAKDFGGRSPDYGFAPSPLIDGEKLILVAGAEKGALVALKKTMGEMIWQGGGDDVPGYATPVIATINGTKQYVAFLDGNLAGVDAATGRRLWAYPYYFRPCANVATPLVIGDSVFITTSYDHGCVMFDVRGDKVDVRWKNMEMQAHMSSPVYYKGHIYGIGDPGFLMCLDPATGKALWKQNGFEKGGIVIVEGVIIALNGSNGDLIMAEATPTAYHELGRTPGLGGRSWTAPIVAEGRIIIRNQRAIACLVLR
jgi:outer membrane protein assembly factor BamB